uniref:NADH-ubiquinone oxidoreductase chain 2 n=1 Tax=Phyllopsora corallina TaxID=1986077 RepID=A0A1X9Q0S7_9LECA|nr:NADH dehydrogenase subunit 2 [Phyllopsora corallina]ARQ15970.1 NADH dehydrogenase subunit 2 [Phyllopsora corallina]
MIIYSILFLLLSNAVTSRRDKSILYSRKTVTIMMYCSFLAINSLSISFMNKGLGLYGGLFHTTPITQTFNIFIFLLCGLILQLTAFYPRKVWHVSHSSLYSILLRKFDYDKTSVINKMAQQFKIIEYPLILLFIITGGIFLMSCSDIVSIFLSIELQSYGLYLLSTIYRNSELSTSAGLTYFLLGGLSSCFILLGTSLLYANYGSTNLDAYYIINNISNITVDYTKSILDSYKPLYLNISLLIMSVGFLFKISAAPFHFWSPDVYDAIPTVVTTFVAIIAKITILIFLLGFTHYTESISDNFSWKTGLLLSSFLSLIVGAVLGLTQSRIKRLFAYSTISHLGFILLAIRIGSFESTEAFIFYLIQYSISNLNAFIILIVIGFSLYTLINNGPLKHKYKNLLDRNNSPIQLIGQLKGYFYINAMLALSLVITLFSFVGIPPLIGFFAKQMVLSAALDEGYFFFTLIAIVTSVISAVYYLGIIKQMFFDNHNYKLTENIKNTRFSAKISTIWFKDKANYDIEFIFSDITLSSFFSITISILTLTLLLFIYNPTNLLNAVLILAHLTINP